MFLSKREIILLQCLWKNRNCFSVVLLTFRTIQPVKLHWLNTCWSLKDLNHRTADLPQEDICYFLLVTLPIQSQISFENCWPATVPGETEVDLRPNFKLSECSPEGQDRGIHFFQQLLDFSETMKPYVALDFLTDLVSRHVTASLGGSRTTCLFIGANRFHLFLKTSFFSLPSGWMSGWSGRPGKTNVCLV